MLARGGELDGVRLLSPERVSQATALQTSQVDAVLSWPTSRALGYMLGGEASPLGRSPAAFGHPGSGGSIGFADPANHFAFALTKTRLVTAPPEQDAAYLVAEATRAALGLPLSSAMAAQ
jgi:CubicO group peptidase (beta-lactamase class C family)